jgi:hypothetical protein
MSAGRTTVRAQPKRSPTTSSGGAACASQDCTVPHVSPWPLDRRWPNSARFLSADIAAWR